MFIDCIASKTFSNLPKKVPRYQRQYCVL